MFESIADLRYSIADYNTKIQHAIYVFAHLDSQNQVRFLDELWDVVESWMRTGNWESASSIVCLYDGDPRWVIISDFIKTQLAVR